MQQAPTFSRRNKPRSLHRTQALAKALSKDIAAIADWSREHPSQRDEAWYRREIAPRLDAFTLGEIAAATGLSLAACSRFRKGTRVPHQGIGKPYSLYYAGRNRIG